MKFEERNHYYLRCCLSNWTYVQPNTYSHSLNSILVQLNVDLYHIEFTIELIYEEMIRYNMKILLECVNNFNDVICLRLLFSNFFRHKQNENSTWTNRITILNWFPCGLHCFRLLFVNILDKSVMIYLRRKKCIQ